MPTAQYGVSLSAGGVSIQQTINRTSDGPIALQTSLTYGKTVTAWVKTDANTAACDLPGGHGYSNGDFDVFWTAGGVEYCRYNVPGTISTNALSLDGGGGTDFPASATVGVIVCRNVEASLLIDGDNVKIIGIVAESTDPDSTAVAHVTFEDAAGDDIAQLTLVANVPQIFDISGGATNIFTGDVIINLACGNGSNWDGGGAESLTLKVVGMQDATP